MGGKKGGTADMVMEGGAERVGTVNILGQSRKQHESGQYVPLDHI